MLLKQSFQIKRPTKSNPELKIAYKYHLQNQIHTVVYLPVLVFLRTMSLPQHGHDRTGLDGTNEFSWTVIGSPKYADMASSSLRKELFKI